MPVIQGFEEMAPNNIPAFVFEEEQETLPIISLGNITATASGRSDNDKIWTDTSYAFDKALSSMGFVYLSDHGIPQNLIQSVFKESLNFFNLEQEIKMKYQRDFTTTFHGYTAVGGIVTPENVSIEYRESFDAALATADIFSATNCTYPDDKVPKFQPTIKDLMAECRKLSKTLLKLLGIALKGNSSFFLECHSNLDDPTIPSFSQLRSLYYPSIDKQGASVEGATRCAEHTDYGTLTLLMQDSMGGLEVKSALTGKFIKANPIPGCILVNVGDLLQIWSNGRYPSTVHRVIIPEEECKHSKPRQSIAAFIKPNNDTIVTSNGKVAEEVPVKLQGRPRKSITNNNMAAEVDENYPYSQQQHQQQIVLAGEHFKKRTVQWRD